MKIMKWKKLVTLGCVVVMTVSSVTACGSNTTENQTVEATEQSEENQSDSVIVQVTAVEGDQITADVGTLTTASADASGNGAPGGEAPSGEAPGGDDSGNGAPGEAPSGEAPGGRSTGAETDSGKQERGRAAPSGGSTKWRRTGAVRCRAAAVLRLPVRALPLP